MDEFKKFLYEHGAYWGLAVTAVALSKLYTEGEDQSVRSIIRSFLAAGAFTYLAVHYGVAQGLDATFISVSVFLGSFLIDVFVELLMHLKRRLLADPDGVLNALKSMWSNRK